MRVALKFMCMLWFWVKKISFLPLCSSFSFSNSIQEKVNEYNKCAICTSWHEIHKFELCVHKLKQHTLTVLVFKILISHTHNIKIVMIQLPKATNCVCNQSTTTILKQSELFGNGCKIGSVGLLYLSNRNKCCVKGICMCT